MTSVAVATLLFLGACVADDIPVDGPIDVPANGSTTHTPNSFAAFRLAADYGGTRTEENGIFSDDGTVEERVLYLDYPEGEVHHVMLFFDKNGAKIEITDPETEVRSYIVPLTLTPKFEENNSTPETDDNNEDGENNDDNDDNEEEYVGSTYTYLFAEMPSDVVSKILTGKVLTVVNASSSLIERLKAMTTGNTEESGSNDYERILSFLQSADNVEDFFLTTENERYFTMTSSMVIREGEVVSAADNQLKFWETPELAKRYPYTLYVERLLSKYTVEFKDPETGNFFFLSNKIKSNDSLDSENGDQNDIEALAQTDDYTPDYRDKFIITPKDAKKLKYVTYYTRRQTIDEEKSLGILEGEWKVNIVGWGINNLEQKQYLFKKIRNINYYDNWKGLNRTYWGEDLHYSTTYYPDQYRSVLRLDEQNKFNQDTKIRDYESMEKGITTANPLTCLSFNDLVKKDLIVYTPENTFEVSTSTVGVNPLKTQTYLRMNTHLIVGAQLLIAGFDNVYDSNEIDSDGLVIMRNQEVQTKLYMNGIYWAEDAYKDYVAEYLGYYMMDKSNKKLFGENDGYIYINKEGGKADYHHFYLAPAHIEGGDGWVYLCPSREYTFYVRNPNYIPPVKTSESDSSSEGEVNPGEPGDSEDEVPDEEEEYIMVSHELLEVLAYQHPELMAKRFDKGRMYYVAPTSHNTNFGMATGKYGSLRNNWYNFKVEEIKNVGTPVAVPTQPIVPNNEPLNNAIGISVKILGWHGEYEDVDIGNQHPGGVPKNDD